MDKSTAAPFNFLDTDPLLNIFDLPSLKESVKLSERGNISIEKFNSNTIQQDNYGNTKISTQDDFSPFFSVKNESLDSLLLYHYNTNCYSTTDQNIDNNNSDISSLDSTYQKEIFDSMFDDTKPADYLNFKKYNFETTRKQYKTRLCSFWQAGTCKRGNKCCWAHGSEDQRNIPDTRKTTLCKNWIQGICPHSNENCVFAHGDDDLKKINGRLFLCGAHQRGDCIKGKDCPYAHSIEELSSITQPSKIYQRYKTNSEQNYNNIPVTLYNHVNIIDLMKGLVV